MPIDQQGRTLIRHGLVFLVFAAIPGSGGHDPGCGIRARRQYWSTAGVQARLRRAPEGARYSFVLRPFDLEEQQRYAE
jgi:hypothetical protein